MESKGGIYKVKEYLNQRINNNSLGATFFTPKPEIVIIFVGS